MTIKEYIYALPQNISVEMLKGIDTLFHFDVQGEGGGQFTIRAVNQQLDIQEGLLGEPNCVVSGKARHMQAILKGQLNPMMAVLTGKIKISDNAEVMKVAKILGLM